MAMKARFLAASLAAAATCVCVAAVASAFDVPTVAFEEGFSPLFGDGNLVRARDDRTARLLLDRRSGSGFISSDYYLHGFFSASIKLPRDYTADVVVAFYLSNGDVYEKTHDELDFEFLGSRWAGQWRVQTNVYGNGSTSRGREERYLLPFDPTLEAHRYSILWAPTHIIFYVDETPIREVVRHPGMGGDFPAKPMAVYATIWDGSAWATEGGKYKVNYKYAPFASDFSDLSLPRMPRRRPGVGAAPQERCRRRVRPPGAHDGRLRGHDPAEARRHARVPGAADDLHGVLRRGAVRGWAVPGVRQLGRGEGDVLGVGRVQDRGHEDARPRAPRPGEQGRRRSKGTRRRGEQLSSYLIVGH